MGDAGDGSGPAASAAARALASPFVSADAGGTETGISTEGLVETGCCGAEGLTVGRESILARFVGGSAAAAA